MKIIWEFWNRGFFLIEGEIHMHVMHTSQQLMDENIVLVLCQHPLLDTAGCELYIKPVL